MSQQLLNALGQPGASGEVKAPELADIYIYDWESIFGKAGEKNRPKQAKANQPKGSMFASGGPIQTPQSKNDSYSNVGYIYDMQGLFGTELQPETDNITEELLKILRG